MTAARPTAPPTTEGGPMGILANAKVLVLAHIRRGGGRYTLAELAYFTGQPVETVHAACISLVRTGRLGRPAHGRRYGLPDSVTTAPANATALLADDVLLVASAAPCLLRDLLRRVRRRAPHSPFPNLTHCRDAARLLVQTGDLETAVSGHFISYRLTRAGEIRADRLFADRARETP